MPLTPKPVLVLLAMTLTVAATGRPSAPAYRALTPALLATGGAVLTLFLVALTTLDTPSLRFADGSPIRLAVGDFTFDSPLHWLLLVLAVLLAAGGVYLLVRPPRFGAIEPPASGRSRRIWVGLWVAAGAVLLLAANTPLLYHQWLFTELSHGTDVNPIVGVESDGGALSWYAGFAFGLLMMVGPWLLAGAAVRPYVAGNPRLRLLARWLMIAAGVFLIVLVVLERIHWEYFPVDWIYHMTDPYWGLINPDSFVAIVWLELVLAIAVGVGVAVPSYLRARRRPAGKPGDA